MNPEQNRSEWLAIPCERFGIPPDVFDGYELDQLGRKYLVLVPRSIPMQAGYDSESTGMPFLRINISFPKLTTAATMRFGRHATRNVVPLDHSQAQVFVARQECSIRSEQVTTCTSDGYVIVSYDGIPLGIAFLHLEDRVINSLFPTAWAVRSGARAPQDSSRTEGV